MVTGHLVALIGHLPALLTVDWSTFGCGNWPSFGVVDWSSLGLLIVEWSSFGYMIFGQPFALLIGRFGVVNC